MATLGDIVVNLRMNAGPFVGQTRVARGGLKGLGVQAGTTTTSLGRFTAGMGALAAVGAGGAAFAFLRAATRDAHAYGQALQSSTAIQQTTRAQVEEMRRTTFAVASTVTGSAEDMARGYFFLASAGQSVEQQIASLPQVARFAQAGQFDLAVATDLATDAQSALGMTTKNAASNLVGLTRVTDVLVKANTLANASVEQFSRGLTSGAGASAKDVGKSIEETVATLAVFADQGIKAENAGTAFAMVMRDLQTKSIRNASTFRAHGIAVFDAAGEMRNMADILVDLERRFEGVSDQERKATLLALGFADKSVGALQKLIGTSKQLREYQTQLEDAAGTTAEVADKQFTRFGRAANKLSAAWDEVKIKLGTPLLDVAAVGMSNFADNLRIVLGLEKELAATVQSVNPDEMRWRDRVFGEFVAKHQDKLGSTPTPLAADKVVARLPLSDAESLGTSAQTAQAELAQLFVRASQLRDALRSGALSAEQFAVSYAHIGEQIDEATGGAQAMIGSLERELQLLHLTAAERERIALLDAGARPEHVERIAALQDEIAARKQLADQRTRDAERAKQIADSVTTPAEQMREQIAEARRLNQQGLLSDSSLQRLTAQLREQWAGVNEEVERHRQLVASAASVYSGEAANRIFTALAESRGSGQLAPQPPVPAAAPFDPRSADTGAVLGKLDAIREALAQLNTTSEFERQSIDDLVASVEPL